ncbi:MAG: putative bacterioferritin-associated ferredoxin Bfd [Paucimonas sp.]|jgi:bacterioferritin-associated ferredoxin|nr:putative bacterioferritin-associated ferredoxin Bfd [Paucimonas sp.]
MIVCVCNNVSDRKIRAAVEEGATSMRELRIELEVGTCCGKCHSCAKQVLRECLAEKEAATTMFFQPGALAA